MRPDSKRDFLLRWATIANGSAALPTLTDAEIAAVAGGLVAEPLYGVRVPQPPFPPHPPRPFPIVPPRIVAEYGPLSPA